MVEILVIAAAMAAGWLLGYSAGCKAGAHVLAKVCNLLILEGVPKGIVDRAMAHAPFIDRRRRKR